MIGWRRPNHSWRFYIGGMGAKDRNFYHTLATRYGFGDARIYGGTSEVLKSVISKSLRVSDARYLCGASRPGGSDY